MNIRQAIEELSDIDDSGESPVVCINSADGTTYSIRGIERESHEDGGATIWIQVEEN